MSRYVLAPAAAHDLVRIWLYIKDRTSKSAADRVETTIRKKMALIAGTPGLGHSRRDLTTANVRFLAIYSYLIVYRPSTKPLQIAAVLHGSRDISTLLKKQF